MKKRLMWLLGVMFLLNYQGQTQYVSVYPLMKGQGDAGVADISHGYIDINPASSAWQEIPIIHMNYVARFMMAEFADKNITFIYPLQAKLGTFSTEIQHTGFSALHTLAAKVNFARQFAEKFAMGLNFDYFQLATDQAYYGRKHAFTFEAGLQYRFNEKLTLGSYLFNPIQPKLSTVTIERIPVQMVLGAVYRFNESFIMLADVKKVQKQEPTAHVGFRYTFSPKIQLLSGTSFHPFGLHAGSIFLLQKIELIWSVQYQQILGFSSGVGIHYTIDRQPKNSSYE